jgi:hypothetical protein
LAEAINAPLSGDEKVDYIVRRNQVEAARVLLQVRTQMMLEAGGSRLVSFPLPSLVNPEDAVEAHAAALRAISDGRITPAEGRDVSRMISSWVESMKAVRWQPLRKREQWEDPHMGRASRTNKGS